MSDFQLPPPINYTLDGISVVMILAALGNLLPPAAAVIGIIWYSIQTYESRTVQHWLRNRAMKKAARKAARLKARLKVTEAELAALEKLRHARHEAAEAVDQAKADAVIVAASEGV